MSLPPRWQSLLLAFAILLVDFITKRIVLANTAQFSAGIPIIDGILSFTYVRNAGAAFGLFQGGRWPFVVVSSVAAVVLVIALWRQHSHGLRRVAYCMILAGAIGNLIDRLFYDGKVVDFILMSWQGHNFPVYNVADMGVSIGATFLVISMLRESRATETAGEAQPKAPGVDSRVDPHVDS